MVDAHLIILRDGHKCDEWQFRNALLSISTVTEGREKLNVKMLIIKLVKFLLISMYKFPQSCLGLQFLKWNKNGCEGYWVKIKVDMHFSDEPLHSIHSHSYTFHKSYKWFEEILISSESLIKVMDG